MARTCQKYQLTGERFGQWTVTSRADKSAVNNSSWNCLCACGTEKRVIGYLLIKGQSISCGCVPNPPAENKRHPLYVTWAQMKGRCNNPNNVSYKYYGAKGVFVCARWTYGEGGLSGFQCFVADMGSPPSPSHTVDRWPDNTGPYSPDNCRWATKLQQTQNRAIKASNKGPQT